MLSSSEWLRPLYKWKSSPDHSCCRSPDGTRLLTCSVTCLVTCLVTPLPFRSPPPHPQNRLGAQLSNYGLKYDDIRNEADTDVEAAMAVCIPIRPSPLPMFLRCNSAPCALRFEPFAKRARA